MRKNARRWLARQLVRAANRLDGTHPVGMPQARGGWVIEFGGVPLGSVNVSDVQVVTDRPWR